MTGDSTLQELIVSESGGLLDQETGDGGANSFADKFDFDSTLAGSQHLAAGPSTTLGVVNGGNDSLEIEARTQTGASLDGTTINMAGGPDSELDFSAMTDPTVTQAVYDFYANKITSPDVNFNDTGAPFGRGIHLYTASGTVNILGIAAGQEIESDQDQQTTFNIGDGTVDLASAIQGSFGLEGPGGSLNIRDLTTAASNVTINNYAITGLSAPPAEISVGTTIDTFSLVGGNGGDTFTIINPQSYQNDITTGTGNNVVTLEGQVYGLVLTQNGATNLVNIDGAQGTINIPDAANSAPTSIVADYSQLEDPVEAATLSSTNQGSDVLTGLAASGGITFGTVAANSLTIKASSQVDSKGNADSLAIDFSGNYPLPRGGLTYYGGGVNTMTLQGSPATGPNYAETSDATGPGSGSVSIAAGPLQYSGLLTLADTTPVTNYTFNDQSGIAGEISIGPGATVGGVATTLIDGFGTAQFAEQEYANKSNVTINTGAGNDLVDLTASTLAMGTTTTLNGQGGTNTLNIDAGGATIKVATDPSILGADEITSPSFGTLIVENFQDVNLLNYRVQGPTISPPTFGTIRTITGLIGTPLINVDVATFTSSVPNASSTFSATIYWADGTTSAGTIVPDASTPTVYHVEGTHTYSSEREDSVIGITVAQVATTTVIVGGATLAETSTVTATTTTPVNITATTTPSIESPDFDGDGKTDISIYGKIPGTNLYGFTILTSSSNFTKKVVWDNQGYGFGNASSIPVPADYFGEGKAAYAILSPDGHGYMILQVISSVNPAESLSIDFGLTSDVPVIADVDGDGKADFGVYGYDPNLGYRYDFLLSSRGFGTNKELIFNNYGYGYGVPGATPVVADFDGSGHAGFGVYIPSGGTGTFTYINVKIPTTSTGPIINPPASYFFARTYGFSTDIPMAVDFDGDGKADLAFYGLDPRTGKYHYDVLTSSTNFNTSKDVYFDNAGYGYGYSATIPVMADYEGNGHDDFGVFQPDASGGEEFVIEDVGIGHGVVFDFASMTGLPVTAPAFLLAKKVRGQ